MLLLVRDLLSSLLWYVADGTAGLLGCELWGKQNRKSSDYTLIFLTHTHTLSCGLSLNINCCVFNLPQTMHPHYVVFYLFVYLFILMCVQILDLLNLHIIPLSTSSGDFSRSH